MKPFVNYFATALLAVSTTIPATLAYSMPIPVQRPAAERPSDVTDIAWRRVCNRNRCHRTWVRPRTVVRPRIVVRPRVVIRPRAVVRPRVVVRPGTVIRHAGNRHVTWCLNHYKSYNPATDRFLGYDGIYHRCNSPYR